jgi:DNA-binding MarR family transcriptional regulator
MASRGSAAPRTPFNKLCDIFVNVLERVLTDEALEGAPCDGLSLSQWQGLLFIQRHAKCPIRQLAEGLGVSHPAAVKLVERLARKGLIKRQEGATDRRVVELSLSASGRACVDYVRDHRARGLERIMAQLESDEAEGLRRGLQAFVHAALADRGTVSKVCLHCGVEHVAECLVSQAREQHEPTAIPSV